MQRRVFVLVLVASLIEAACSSTPSPLAAPAPGNAPTHYPIVVVDDRGKALTLGSPPQRVVSLAPSATEIVFALGAGGRVVATDDFSDYPAEAKALPKLGGFRTSPDAIVAYSPDIILATTSGNLPAQLDALNQPIFIFEPNDLEGVFRNIVAVGQLFDRGARAQQLVADMRSRIGAIAEKAKQAATKPRVLHEVDSTDPNRIYVAGPRNFVDSMITICGGVNVAADVAFAFPRLSPEQIVASNPDVIVLADFRYGTTPEVVAARQGWGVITAVKTNAIHPIDDDLVSRPGPRLVLGFEAYAKILHPELFGRP